MNAKQTIPMVTIVPAIIAAAPPILLIGGVVFLAWAIFSGGKKKPEIAPVNSGGNASAPSVPAPVPANYILIPAEKKFISRQDMEQIFAGGRGLTRKSAVAALIALGYGKTAAYKALAINGRFASWLQFAPDGIITWQN
jgi:hypothetical protein